MCPNDLPYIILTHTYITFVFKSLLILKQWTVKNSTTYNFKTNLYKMNELKNIYLVFFWKKNQVVFYIGFDLCLNKTSLILIIWSTLFSIKVLNKVNKIHKAVLIKVITRFHNGDHLFFVIRLSSNYLLDLYSLK